MNIKERLKSRMGYVFDDELDEMIAEFGENYPIVVKYYITREREVMTLLALKNIALNDIPKYASVMEVFISSDQYDKLFGKIENL